MISTRNGTYRPSGAVITVDDPDKEFFHIHAEGGGTLEIRTEARNYSKIEVIVEPVEEADNGNCPDFSAKVYCVPPQPAVIQLPINSEGEYTVTVTHLNHKESGKSSPPQEFAFSIHTCPLCNHK